MLNRPSRALVASSLSLLFLAACASSDRNVDGAPAPGVAPPAPTAAAVRAFVAHRDERTGAQSPSFVWLAKEDGVSFASATEAATVTLDSVRETFALSAPSFAAVTLASIDDHGHGAIIARFRQRAGGIDVFRGGLAVAMTRDLSPVSASGLLAPSLVGAERPFVRSAGDAVADALLALSALPASSRSAVLQRLRAVPSFTSLGTHGDYEHFAARGLALASPARAKKVFFPEAAGVMPAYYVELDLMKGPAYAFVVSAADGKVIFSNDLVRKDAFEYRVYADPTTKIPLDGPQGNGFSPYPASKPVGIKPTWGVTQPVSLSNYPFSKNDPWLAPGATILSGNNVHAYNDLNAPDGIGGDVETPASGAGQFDALYDTTQSPGATPANLAGSATHLFYVTNFLHDWYYDLGFDEASGNHQVDNFGRGGLGHDPLKAESEDYSGRNNSDAMVPADGASPRLQMYVFSGPSVALVEVVTPAALAGKKDTGLGSFGKDQFDFTGTVVLATDDQGNDANDACEPLTSDVTGKIVLAHRGLCSFVQKAQNVQDAGGTAVIVANVATSADPTTPPFMGGTSSTITIPALSLALADGQALEKALPGGATVHMQRLLQTDLDGSLDTSIVAHEWGHVISNRLISDGAGLTTNQSGGLGEGWADFSAQLLMTRADDIQVPAGANWQGAYPTGAYATSGAGADFYFGIRRVPYSIDFAKDPLTFKHIANGTPLPTGVPISFGEDGSFNSEVHSTGEVWATMLWECYASLLRDGRYTFTQAQQRMKTYYVASLKLTPPDPTLLEARDAVLAAAFASDAADYQLFWGAFGRRGAGVGALGPSKDSQDNTPVTESYYVGNDVQVTSAIITDDIISCDHDGILDEGETGSITLAVRNSGPGALSETTAKLSSKTAGVVFPDGDTLKIPPMKTFAAAKVRARIQIHGAKPIDPIAVDVDITDPTFPAGHVSHVSVPTRYEADEAASSSTVDHVDTKGSSWTVSGTDAMGMAVPWSRIPSGDDKSWYVPNAVEPSEERLTSTHFAIDKTAFTLSFRHRWSFRISRDGTSLLDGGVVELSLDKGKTWNDVDTYGKVDYTGTLGTGRGDSTLEGRKAYAGMSPGYPAQWVTSRIAIDVKTHPASIMMRFRTAAGSRFVGAPGWEVDDISLEGLSAGDKPFWSFIEHADRCDPKGPTAMAPSPETVKSTQHVKLTGTGTSPENLPLEYTWIQIEGTPVALTDDRAGNLDFDAPDVGTETVKLTFALRADDGKLLSPVSTVDVTVVPADPVPFSAGGSGCSAGAAEGVNRASSPLGLSGIVLGFLALGALGRRRRAP